MRRWMCEIAASIWGDVNRWILLPVSLRQALSASAAERYNKQRVCHCGAAMHADLIVCALFKILGWSKQSKGRWQTAAFCTALSICLNLRDTKLGVVLLQNTEKRTTELVETIKRTLAFGRLRRHYLEGLRGRLRICSWTGLWEEGRACLLEALRSLGRFTIRCLKIWFFSDELSQSSIGVELPRRLQILRQLCRDLGLC